jgi:hypothetical protein
MTRPATSKVLLYAAALFAAGSVIGAVTMYHLTPAPQPLKLGRAGEIAARIRAKLDSRLQLTPEQQQKFEPFILKTSADLESVHKDCLDRISAALDQLHAQISPDLTPAQKQSLAALETERRQMMLQKYNYNSCAATTNTLAP